MLINHQALIEIVTQICIHAGTPAEDAAKVGRHLVDANLKGHDSHGIGMLPAYIHNISVGNLIPTQHAELIADNGSNLIVDGKFGFGQVVGPEAIEMGIQRAKQYGIAVVALKNAHHLGRIGAMAETCAAAGFISMHYVNVVGHGAYVTPFGGIEPRMGTNPFCCAIPVADSDPIVLDMASSSVAAGKVRVAFATGTKVPEGALLDHQGRETNDPKVFYTEPRGSLAHFGRHKGYGLALICELLGGALAGGWTQQPENERKGNIVNNMLTFILDPATVGDPDRFESETRSMIEYVKSSAAATGVDEVLIAGEPERIATKIRLEEGIPVDDNTWAGILDTGKSVGFDEDAIGKLIEE